MVWFLFHLYHPEWWGGKGVHGDPPLEHAMAIQLCPMTTSWQGNPNHPSKDCKFSSNLTDKAYKAYGQGASALHAMILLQVYQAIVLMDMPQGGSDLTLRVTKVMARSVGQAMVTIVV